MDTQKLPYETIYEFEYFQLPEYEYRLGHQVRTPLWFYQTVPLKTT